MNFLAHLYLSGENADVMIGNFIGDFVKGRDFTRFTTGIQKGIELHRSIDEFTDGHDQVLESKKRLRASYHHYSGVLVDIFYDHLLANHWRRFSDEPLEDFVKHCYTVIQERSDELPLGVNKMMPHMIRGNWLVNYRSLEGIRRVFKGLSRRTSFTSGMEHAVIDLKLYYHAFEKEFLLFFPELRKFADHWLSSNLTANEQRS